MFGFKDYSSLWNESHFISSSIKTLDITVFLAQGGKLGKFLKNSNQIQKLILRYNWNIYINNIPSSIKSLYLLESISYDWISLKHLTFIQKLKISISNDISNKIDQQTINDFLNSLPNNITELSIYSTECYNNISSKFINILILILTLIFRSYFIKINFNFYIKTFNFWYQLYI